MAESTLREPQALVDVEAAVQIRIVDQALPADRGARLLEIDPHHDLELVGEILAQGGEVLGIFERGLGIMHRAGADDDQKPVVLAVEDGMDGVARCHHHAGGREGARDLPHHILRRAQLFQFADTKIIGRAQHGGLLSVSRTCRPIKKPPGLAAVRTFASIFRLSAILLPPASCRS